MNALAHPFFSQFPWAQLLPLLWVSEGWPKHSSAAPYLEGEFASTLTPVVGTILFLVAAGLNFPFAHWLSAGSPPEQLKATCITHPTMTSIFSPATMYQVPFMLPISDFSFCCIPSASSQRKFSAFKGWYGWIGPTSKIQHKLPILRSITLITFTKSLCSVI